MIRFILGVSLFGTASFSFADPPASSPIEAPPAPIKDRGESALLDRSKSVPLGPPRPFALPEVKREWLVNGMRLAAIEIKRFGNPVQLNWIFPFGGSASDPKEKEGLATFVSELLTSGAGDLKGEELVKGLLGTGFDLSIDITKDALELKLFGPKENIDDAMAFVADIVRRPTFPEDAIERHRGLVLEHLRRSQESPGDPQFWAEARFSERLFGGHSYGRSMSKDSVENFSRLDLQDFARKRIVPRGSILAAGGVSIDELKRIAAKHFGDWTGPEGDEKSSFSEKIADLEFSSENFEAIDPAAMRWAIDLIDQPGVAQSRILMGHVSIKNEHPDAMALFFLMRILGESYIGRLGQNLRVDKGWTYGAYGEQEFLRRGSVVRIHTAVQKDKTGDAVREILGEIRRLKTEVVPEKEFEMLRNFVYGRFLREKQTVQNVTEAVRETELYDRSADHINTFREKLFTITPEQVLEAAQKYLAYSNIHIVITGDAAEVFEDLSEIARVRVFDRKGQELKDYPEKKKAS